MAIKTFKNIEEKKGYRLDDKDRKIFEKEIKRGYFGFDVGDIIEFVIYDSSDNQLPQESVDGQKVRYINYTDETIKNYFGKVPENKFNKKSNNAEEYFINTEKLIKEAGYSNGVFKTQVTFLNRRLGSEPRLFDKVWIHEISPSRTEVRVLPVVEDGVGIPNSDLQERYDTFINCGVFTADTLIFIDEFLSQFDVSKVVKNMLMKKGSITEGKDYIKLITSEFGLVNFEVYLTRVKRLFQEIVDNYRMNRYYNPFEANFGQLTGESFGIEFDISEIKSEICDMASNAAEYSLPNQNIRLNTTKTITQQQTLDKVKDILKTVRVNKDYQSTRPNPIDAQIRGCIDPEAKNYNKAATIPSQCVYEIKEAKYRRILMCNDRGAKNYNKDGKCDYTGRCENKNADNYGKYQTCIVPTPPSPRPQPNPQPSGPKPQGPTPQPPTGGGTPNKTLVVSPSSYSSSANGDTKTSTVSTSPSGGTGRWTVVGKPSWMSQVSTSGTIGGKIKYKTSKNTGDARSGDIVITSSKYGTAKIRITQAKGRVEKQPTPPKGDPTPPSYTFSTRSPNPISVTFNGDVQAHMITITSVGSWNARVTGGNIEDVTLSTFNGSGNGLVEVLRTAPNSTDREKSGTITITHGPSGYTRTHRLEQEPRPEGYGFSGQGGNGGQGGKNSSSLAL